MNKKKMEAFIVDTFKANYDGFPVGVLIQGERPDLMVVDDGRSVRIEVAEIFQDSDLPTGSELKRLESVHDKFENCL